LPNGQFRPQTQVLAANQQESDFNSMFSQSHARPICQFHILSRNGCFSSARKLMEKKEFMHEGDFPKEERKKWGTLLKEICFLLDLMIRFSACLCTREKKVGFLLFFGGVPAVVFM
jgi:hypothetical protein